MNLTKAKLSFCIAFTLFALLLWGNPLQLDDNGARVLAISVLMITLWVTEALPMPVVALMPLVFFPLMQVSSVEETARPYASPIIFLFMGGFLIGLAIEKWELHRRIALNIVNITGVSGNRIVLGFILATGFLSMWLSNTATTMMMFPIAMSVITVIEDTKKRKGNVHNMVVCLLLAIAYASNFGGIATIIGTPPNVAFVAFMEKKYGYTFSFSEWIMVCLPLSVLLMLSLYWVMTRWLYKNNLGENSETSIVITNTLLKLGKTSTPERRVLLIFIMTAGMWITKDLLNKVQTLFKVDDTMIAMAGALVLFAIPSGADKESKRPLLEWEDTRKVAWGILLLFGGGISMATQLEKAGLIQQLGSFVASYAGSNVLVLIIVITLVSIFISEAMSNVAQVIVFAPVVAGIADALHISPLLLGLPMTLGASCAGMLPMGTPPNAIVFASGRLKLSDMLRTGFVMNVISFILITLFSYFLVPWLVRAL